MNALADVAIGGLDLIPIPRVVGWPSTGNFAASLIAVYDWDILALKSEEQNFLPSPLNLCVMGTPCRLSLFGDGNSVLYRGPNSYVACSLSNGCSSIYISSAVLDGGNSEEERSFFNLDGSELRIENSTMRSFVSISAGSAIQALRGSSLSIVGTVFVNLYSAKGGGAISAIGATLRISDSDFINCTSSVDGGAISAANFSCTQSAGISSSIYINSSSFRGCEASGAGGAISSSSGICVITSSLFSHCRAQFAGGAIAVSDGLDGSGLMLLGSTLESNHAAGLGGGAVFIQKVNATLTGVNFTNNKADNGGGGAILWDSYKPIFVCGPGSYAVADFAFSCQNCEAGKYQSGLGFSSAVSCLSCGPGTFSFPGSPFCNLCESGKYSTVPEAAFSSSCLMCLAGKFQSGVGMIAELNCTECPAGSFSQVDGSSTCAECQTGKISIVAGSRSIFDCGAQCLPGTYSGSSSCLQCLQGKFSTGRIPFEF